MAQDSIAYGESLLADIRKRNDQAYQRAKKDARNEAWKNLGMKVAIGVAEDVMDSKFQSFINNEKQQARAIDLSGTLENGTKTVENYEAAQDFAGGEKAYYADQLLKKVEGQLSQKFTPGTYNQYEFNALARTIRDGYLDKYYESAMEEVEAAKNFFVNNDPEEYKQRLEKVKDDYTIGGAITDTVKKIPFISNLTGDSKQDIVTANQTFRKDAVELKAFQDAFRKTGSAGLADFVAQHYSDITLGRKDPNITYSDVKTRKIKDRFGNETEESYITQTVTDSVDGTSKVYELRPDANGEYKRVSAAEAELEADNEYVLDDILNNEEAITSGTNFILSQSDEDINFLSQYNVRSINKSGTGQGSGKDVDDAVKGMAKRRASTIVLGGYRAETQGWGTRKEGEAVAFELLLLEAEQNDKTVVSKGIGRSNIFNTLMAYSNAIDKNRVNKGAQEDMQALANDFKALYVEYLNMPEEKRKDIRTLIGDEPEEAGFISGGKAGFNNFKGKLSFQDSTDKDKKRDFGDVIKMLDIAVTLDPRNYEIYKDPVRAILMDASEQAFAPPPAPTSTEDEEETVVVPPPASEGVTEKERVVGGGFDVRAMFAEIGERPANSGTSMRPSQDWKAWGKLGRIGNKLEAERKILEEFKANDQLTPAVVERKQAKVDALEKEFLEGYKDYMSKYAPKEDTSLLSPQ